MKIKDILALTAPNVVTIICEPDGKLYYTGASYGAYPFDDLEIERINIANNQLIITIKISDILD